MTYSYSPTLSQTFDSEDFIQPDIVSLVDESVRKTCDEALAYSNLDSDLANTFNIKASHLSFSYDVPEGAVPSLDPDEFLSYEQPEAPQIHGFKIEKYETEAEAREISDIELYIPEEDADVLEGAGFRIPEYEVEADIWAIPQAEPTGSERAVDIPEFPEISDFTINRYEVVTEDHVVLEIPEVSDINSGINMVRRDLYKYEEGAKKNIQMIVIIAIIAILVILYYTIFSRIGLIVNQMG